MSCMKIHKVGDSEIVSVCDENLIGKSFKEKDSCLEITERFYKGEVADGPKILEVCDDAKNVNVIGEESVKLFVDAGVISEESIRKIKGVPFAIIV